jgi:hypothetical protein
VFIGGNGFRTAAAIEPLEAATGRPVLTSNQVLLWQLLEQAHDISGINGYGRLLARALAERAARTASLARSRFLGRRGLVRCS